MRTITLSEKYSFKDALQKMLDGECLGIKPEDNTGYIKLFKPVWMNDESVDYGLCWNGGEDMMIRTNQFLGVFQLVVADNRELTK